MNTQWFKVIPTEDFEVVVDFGTHPNNGDKFISLYEDESYLDINISTVDDFKEWADEDYTDECHKVIGSIGKRLAGVPLIELNDKLQEEAKKYASQYGDAPELIWFDRKEGYKAGYKANTNKYSEKELLIAIAKARMSGQGVTNDSDNEILKSLQKQFIPTEIELEMESTYKKTDNCIHCKGKVLTYQQYFCQKCGENCHEVIEVVKIHNKETNTITAVNYK